MTIAVSAAIFTPQAAATVGALLPPERRAQAITMIFVGWSLATVGGMPLGGYIAHAFGWRAAFVAVGAISAIAAFAVYATVAAGVRMAPLSGASWRRVATSPLLMLVLLVTLLNGAGQFTFFTYVGPSRAALITLLMMSAGLALWGAASGTLTVVLAATALWGLGTFATNSIQQARLAGLAPEVTSASMALNTSAIYLGQAVGSSLGGALISAGMMGRLAWTGAAILLAAAAASAVAERLER